MTPMRDVETGLPTWELFQDRLVHAVVRAQRAQEALAVLLLAIDFVEAKGEVRDPPTAWHRLVAGRLHEILRRSDTAALAPNDVFALLLENVGSSLGATVAVKRTLHDLYALDTGSGVYQIRVRAGAAVAAPPHPPVARTLLEAEVALTRAMQTDETTFAVFDASHDGDLLDRLVAESRAVQSMAEAI